METKYITNKELRDNIKPLFKQFMISATHKIEYYDGEGNQLVITAPIVQRGGGKFIGNSWNLDLTKITKLVKDLKSLGYKVKKEKPNLIITKTK